MDSGQDSLLDLFKAEVETYVAVLNEGLLALEKDPKASDRLEALMRAAHSIKGGARIVGVDQAVRVAHVLEDCFVAAQKGRLALASDSVDTLFRAVDLLDRIAKSAGGADPAWLEGHRDVIEGLVGDLLAVLEGKPLPPPGPETGDKPPAKAPPPEEPQAPMPLGTGESAPTLRPEAPPVHQKAEPPPPSGAGNPPPMDVLPSRPEGSQAPPALARPQPTSVSEKAEEARPFFTRQEEKDRMVRVTAAKIERLMGLAGEVVVHTRWLPPFSQSLLELKRYQTDLSDTLEALKEAFFEEGDQETCKALLLTAKEKTKSCGQFLADRLNAFEVFVSTSANLSDRLYHEVIGVRMRPLADGVGGFPRMVRDLARDLGKKVSFEIFGQSTEVDRDILEKLDAPLTHLIRNALDHGMESPADRLAAGKPEIGRLRLEAAHRSGMLTITVADDGRGVDLEKIRQKILLKGLAAKDMVDRLTESELLDFLFLPGFSTTEAVTEISGRGVGLDVVHSMVHEVGGKVRALSRPGEGMAVFMELPLTLSVLRTFLVEIAGEPYAFPLAHIDRCLVVAPEDLGTVEDRQYFRFDGQNIALVNIHDVLGISERIEAGGGPLSIVVVSDRNHAYGLKVDRFLGECDLVVRPLDPRLGRVPDISAASVMLDGSPVLIFDVEDLVKSIDNLLSGRRLRKVSPMQGKEVVTLPKRILVVDDSITVREMERKILESRGYTVDIAVDGVDGWNAVRTEPYDLVITDIDMPRMNGLEFIKHIKNHPVFKTLPVVIISYKDREEDRIGGLEAGASYYLTKSSFHDDSLLQAVVDLIGEA